MWLQSVWSPELPFRVRDSLWHPMIHSPTASAYWKDKKKEGSSDVSTQNPCKKTQSRRRCIHILTLSSWDPQAQIFWQNRMSSPYFYFFYRLFLFPFLTWGYRPATDRCRKRQTFDVVTCAAHRNWDPNTYLIKMEKLGSGLLRWSLDTHFYIKPHLLTAYDSTRCSSYILVT